MQKIAAVHKFGFVRVQHAVFVDSVRHTDPAPALQNEVMERPLAPTRRLRLPAASTPPFDSERTRSPSPAFFTLNLWSFL